MNHTTLLVDLLGEEEQSVGPVVEDKEAGVLHSLVCHRHVVDVVDGFVNRGVGVEITAKLHTFGFEPRHNLVAGEVFGAVETHVLQEVGKAALVIIFKDRTYFLGDIEIGLTFGSLIVTHIISKTVGEGALTHCRVKRQWVGHLRGGSGCKCHDSDECKQESGKDFFHKLDMMVVSFKNLCDE